jgi:LPS sulfotransferase NodH
VIPELPAELKDNKPSVSSIQAFQQQCYIGDSNVSEVSHPIYMYDAIVLTYFSLNDEDEYIWLTDYYTVTLIFASF